MNMVVLYVDIQKYRYSQSFKQTVGVSLIMAEDYKSCVLFFLADHFQTKSPDWQPSS